MSADHQEDKRFLKTFGVIMVMLGAIAVASFVIAFFISQNIGYSGLRPEQVMLTQERTDPVYRVVTQATATQKVAAGGGGGAAGATKSGKQVFKALCHTCHVPGLMGAPKVSSKAAWKKRFSKGIKTLYKHAIHGFKAMPPKGGNPKLSDKEVKAAVDYILQRAGVK